MTQSSRIEGQTNGQSLLKSCVSATKKIKKETNGESAQNVKGLSESLYHLKHALYCATYHYWLISKNKLEIMNFLRSLSAVARRVKWQLIAGLLTCARIVEWVTGCGSRLCSGSHMVAISKENKPDRATMRPDCYSPCIEHVTWIKREMDELTDERLSSKGDSHNMFVDRLIQYRISPRPKTAEKRGFCTGVKDGRTEGWTEGQTYGRTDGRTERQTDTDRHTDRPTDADENTTPLAEVMR